MEVRDGKLSALDIGSSTQVKMEGRIYEIHHESFLVDCGGTEGG